jgi:phosphoglycolate phosphatase
MNKIRGVLFDLDGTLLDTAPDLVYALNQLRQEFHLPELPLSSIRPIANLGSKAMIKLAFDIDEHHPDFQTRRQKFLDLYQIHLANSTRFFPNIEKVLSHLEQHRIPWGIVTNKLTTHANAILKALRFDQRPACLICGDTVSNAKPHPEPILQACRHIQHEPKNCLYIGDAMTDVLASKAAGTKSLVALYGYIHAGDDPFSWKADGYIHEPIEIIDWLERYPLNELN